MESLYDAAGLMRSHPDYTAPDSVTTRIQALINSGRYGLLSK